MPDVEKVLYGHGCCSFGRGCGGLSGLMVCVVYSIYSCYGGM